MKFEWVPSNRSMERWLYVLVYPLSTVTLALFSGLWWVDGSLAQGVIALLGLVAYSAHNGRMLSAERWKRSYYVVVFLLPMIAAIGLFVYGLLR